MQQGKLQPIGPTPDPEKKTKYWNENAYCEYHRGKGHDTEKCYRLKHAIQDMIEDGRLPIPPGGKPKQYSESSWNSDDYK